MEWFKVLLLIHLGLGAIARFTIQIRNDKSPKDMVSTFIVLGINLFVFIGVLIWL